jgi:FkbM family methyltransferase
MKTVNPTCRLNLHGHSLYCPMSMATPIYLQSYPFFDTLPKRLCQFVRQSRKNADTPVSCIDVGANIGDTLAAFHSGAQEGRFLAIEPSTLYHGFLVKNWGGHSNVTIVKEACVEPDNRKRLTIREEGGTGHFGVADDGCAVATTRTLDAISKEHGFLDTTDILKIDTDGYDLQVLSGAHQLLAESCPIILFECGAFGDSSYISRCHEALLSLKKLGYSQFLVYSHTGYLMGRYSFSDLMPFIRLLLVDYFNSVHYFDILGFADDGVCNAFYEAEILTFSDAIPVERDREDVRRLLLPNH